MVKATDKAIETSGFRATIRIACLIGLVAGLLFGVWDSILVIGYHTLSPWTIYTLPQMLSLTLYSAAVFAILGCLVMMAIGAITAGVIRIGKYSVSRVQLAGILIGVAVLLMVAGIITGPSLTGDTIEIVEAIVICTLSGVGLASLSIYALNKRMRKEELIALSLSFLASVVVLLLIGTWIYMGAFHDKAPSELAPLLASFGLLIGVGIYWLGLYRLIYWILRKYPPHIVRSAGGILLVFTLAALLTISFTGPYGFNSETVASVDSDSGSSEGMPNILWIVMDTVRADHLSSYGYPLDTTPNIDKIASEGILYENAIAPAPWTVPSHASMFTGMFPSKHGVDAEHAWLDGNFETIAEVLRSNGYQTFKYTNNMFVGPITNLQQGFDTYMVRHNGLNSPGKYAWPVDLPDYLMISRAKQYFENNILQMPGDEGAQNTNEVVKKWIADASSAEAPFFMFINYMEAHSPYQPPEEYTIPYLDDGVTFEEAMNFEFMLWKYVAGSSPISDQEFDILRSLYDGEISYVDFRIGQLVDYLRDIDILDNTLLIITSDHGEEFGEHQLANHFLGLYDTLLHVPLIIRYPGSSETGVRIEEQVQLTDIFPTILDVTGIIWSGEEQLQGHSLVKDMEQTESEFAIAREGLYFSALQNISSAGFGTDVHKYARRLMAIRTEEFKFVWASDGLDELYNIKEDPGELNNLIEVESEKAQELKALLKEWLNSFETYRPGEVKEIR